MQTRAIEHPDHFWRLMLPTAMGLTVVLSIVTQMQVNEGITLGQSRALQTTLFLAVFLGIFSVVGMRVTLQHLIESEHRGQAILLGLVSLIISGLFIAYGVSEIG